MKLQKITDSRNGPSRRRYDDACGTAHALDLIGERWALLVMRELMLGPKRFSDIRADLPGISANMLTQRLEGLEAAGLVVAPPAAAARHRRRSTSSPNGAMRPSRSSRRWAAGRPARRRTIPTMPLSRDLADALLPDDGRSRADARASRARIGFRIGARDLPACGSADGRMNVERGAGRGRRPGLHRPGPGDRRRRLWRRADGGARGRRRAEARRRPRAGRALHHPLPLPPKASMA